jgi:hypothetical protein
MFALNWLTDFRGEDFLNIFSIGSYVKTKSSYGGHLEFPIGKRFTNLVQNHPMMFPEKAQFNWFGGFWQEDFQCQTNQNTSLALAAMFNFRSAPKTQIW